MDEIELEEKIDALILERGLTADQVCGVLDIMLHRYKEQAKIEAAETD